MRAAGTLLWAFVEDGAVPGYGELALALFVGGLGLGLAAPILVDVVLAGVPGRNAGAAGGVLSTVNQIGSAIGIAVLGTFFFRSVAGPAADSAGPAGHAFGIVLVASAVLYVVAALVMLGLPRTAAAADDDR
ncbi:hypothetical protein [Streptomyces sp. SID8111]|uniref:hypothetical protein n=1 Tax=Streptomyces sp. SID8111 TaxID=2706100 RepID=UPI001EF38297|nr:hypothetical protein [Streptomyces sp. SID8111]